MHGSKMTTHNEAMYAKATELCGELLLPPAALELRESKTDKIFDVYDAVRRKWVALTPEEWVRQHFVAFLVTHHGISLYRIQNEVSLKLNDTSKRADTVVYDDFLRPQIIVEYKAPDVTLTTDVLHQVLRYNLVFEAPAVMVTNGNDVYTLRNGKFSRGVLINT